MMPRVGSDAMTEEVRSAVESRTTKELSEDVQRIAEVEVRSKAFIYRQAVREYVARWEAEHQTKQLPQGRSSGVFP